jgi:hypothetical protein
MTLIESFVTDTELPSENVPSSTPTLEFYETDELAGRLDNWVGPNIACLLAFCRAAGFARVELRSVINQRAHVVAYRHWEPEPERPSEEPPRITEALNVLTHDPYLWTARDDYRSLRFRSDSRGLTRHSVFPEIGGYGIQPIYVAEMSEGVWQANCRIPPGLDPGWRDVRVRTTRSRFSSPARICVDQAPDLPPIPRLEIAGVTDARTWEPGQVWLSEDAWLSLWVEGLPEEIGREHVKVRLSGAGLFVSFVSETDHRGLRQVNARLPGSVLPGRYEVTVACGSTESAPVGIEVGLPSR